MILQGAAGVGPSDISAIRAASLLDRLLDEAAAAGAPAPAPPVSVVRKLEVGAMAASDILGIHAGQFPRWVPRLLGGQLAATHTAPATHTAHCPPASPQP